MCGLAGILTTDPVIRARITDAVGAMVAPLRHRGPDDSGVWTDADAGVGLGFRRLAIVDLSPLGHQPMASATGRFQMVFNGEVYNAEALAAELRQLGHSFRGHSDTEVMLAAFESWGVQAATRRFNGMFAIALWDRQHRQLHLIRDRLGKKPLFVFRAPGFLTFGSELKALAAGPRFDKTIDEDALGAYLRFFYVPAPLSIFRGTSKLPPGSILTISDVNAPHPAPKLYWSAKELARSTDRRFDGTDADAVDAVEELLADAARLRMGHADVPVGAFLSGGIDSTAVVALMQRQASRPVRTFTIGFGESEWDEARHAQEVAAHLGTDHTMLRLDPDDALDVVPSLADMFDEPFADVSQIPTFLVSRLARSEVIVALSGDGGDEVFGGYNRYVWGSRLFGRLAGVPRPMRRALGNVLTSVRPAGWDATFNSVAPVLPRTMRYRLPGVKLHKMGALMHTDSASSFYGSLVSAWQNPAALMKSGAVRAAAFDELMDGTTPRDFAERMMLTDLLTYLPDNNLAKVDRASMAVSLEVRVPLLDHRIVELALRLPMRMKIRQGITKWVLRQVLYRHVPRQMVDREKMGFDVPIGPWLRGPLREWAGGLLDDACREDRGLLAPLEIRRAWREHQAGTTDHGHGLWVVLMLEAWRARWGAQLAS
jgi:asparagine synthase (glutamine-hydrolysing)